MEPKRHIYLSELAKTILGYIPASGGGRGPQTLVRDSGKHGKRLEDQYLKMIADQRERDAKAGSIAINAVQGLYIEFESPSDIELMLTSLESISRGIRLYNVREYILCGEKIMRATVFIPTNERLYFLRKIQDYINKESTSGKPKNNALISNIENIYPALARAFWTDEEDRMPDEKADWCEIWIFTSHIEMKRNLEIAEFKRLLNKIADETNLKRILSFPERTILIAKVSKMQLEELTRVCHYIAEFRLAQDPAGFLVREPTKDQIEWIKEVYDRVKVIASDVTVCLLDSGVNCGHILLQPILREEDCLTVEPDWGVTDHEKSGGHGTPMAGVAAYYRLDEHFRESANIELTHTLCSVKVVAPDLNKAKPKELWGEVTIQGVSRAETQLPQKRMVFSLSVTSSEDVDKGRPSSWSSAIDQSAFGEGKRQKLFVISAGNIKDPDDWRLYYNGNKLKSVQNPAQAWNALTVGGYTELDIIKDPKFAGYRALAPRGGISPFSSTSDSWEDSHWPYKPDVVFEAGNVIISTNGEEYESHEDVSLISTGKSMHLGPLTPIAATSAAAAQAAWLAGKIMQKYNSAWPETVRGIIVHSAEWKPQMLFQFLGPESKTRKKTDYAKLLRIVGYGVPNVDRCLNSFSNRFTMFSQESIQPFKNAKSECVYNEMHIYELPWPKAELLELGGTYVNLKVTISYFIEPDPDGMGWKDKYRYPSFGLQFDMNKSTETQEDFQKRINKSMREEDDVTSKSSGTSQWRFGKQARRRGSIHSDVWEGKASDLASSNLLAVYPTIGWWRTRRHIGRGNSKARYSIIVSLEAPNIDIDLYTSVLNHVSIPVDAEIMV